MIIWLVVWNMNMNFICFHNIWDNPSHWLIFFRGVGIPPTSNHTLQFFFRDVICIAFAECISRGLWGRHFPNPAICWFGPPSLRLLQDIKLDKYIGHCLLVFWVDRLATDLSLSFVFWRCSSGWWFRTWILWFSIIYGNFIIPIDELIFFRGVGIPPTRWRIGCSLRISYFCMGLGILDATLEAFLSSLVFGSRFVHGQYFFLVEAFWDGTNSWLTFFITPRTRV